MSALLKIVDEISSLLFHQFDEHLNQLKECLSRDDVRSVVRGDVYQLSPVMLMPVSAEKYPTNARASFIDRAERHQSYLFQLKALVQIMSNW
jgi:hypothetical protein